MHVTGLAGSPRACRAFCQPNLMLLWRASSRRASAVLAGASRSFHGGDGSFGRLPQGEVTAFDGAMAAEAVAGYSNVEGEMQGTRVPFHKYAWRFVSLMDPAQSDEILAALSHYPDLTLSDRERLVACMREWRRSDVFSEASGPASGQLHAASPPLGSRAQAGDRPAAPDANGHLVHEAARPSPSSFPTASEEAGNRSLNTASSSESSDGTLVDATRRISNGPPPPPKGGWKTRQSTRQSAATSLPPGRPRIFYYDLETTDLFPRGKDLASRAQAVQFAWASADGDACEQTLVRLEHGRTVSRTAQAVHGIPTSVCRDASLPTFAEAVRSFKDDVLGTVPEGSYPVLAGYNSFRFDDRFVEVVCDPDDPEFGGVVMPENLVLLDVYRLLDTQSNRVKAASGAESLKLADLKAALELNSGGRSHEALGDVKTTKELMEHPSVLELFGVSSVQELIHDAALQAGYVKYWKEPPAPQSASSDTAATKGRAAEAAGIVDPAAAILSGSVAAEDLPFPSGGAEWGVEEDSGDSTETASSKKKKAAAKLDPSLRWGIYPKRPKDMGKGVFTEKQAKQLVEAGCLSFLDVLRLYPRKHEQLSTEFKLGQLVLLDGVVKKATPMKRGGSLALCEFEVVVEGPEGTPTQVIRHTTWGAGRWGFGKVSSDAKKTPAGSRVAVKGVLESGGANRWGSAVAVKSGGELLPLGEDDDVLSVLGDASGNQLMSVYSDCTPLKAADISHAIRKNSKGGVIERALAALEAQQPHSILPEQWLSKLGLIDWPAAARAIHAPEDLEQLELAKKSAAFMELFMVQLNLLRQREQQTAVSDDEFADTAYGPLDTSTVEMVRASLPWELTGDQSKAVEEILEDMQSGRPMLRLLQGDVGSGKTVVAFLSLLAVVQSGGQVVVMAPTEVLVQQHFQKLQEVLEILPEDIRPRAAQFVRGSTSTVERRALRAALSSGELDIMVGTHAMGHDDFKFRDLALVIIDEQHRFGVRQRGRVQGKRSPPPHVLSMTATPIPRTMALIGHGDMMATTIKELPPGRTPVHTEVRVDSKKTQAGLIKEIKAEVAGGGRVFIVVPLVEAIEPEPGAERTRWNNLRAVEEEYERIVESKELGDIDVGKVHGRMGSEEKHEALQAFARGDVQVLLATTVVEVGVDVPAATLMIINGADGFGLSQLHQLRGRVGRSDLASRCILVSPNSTAVERLEVLAASNDGFYIAEADLEMRGQGDVLGTRQSGTASRGFLSTMTIGQMERDMDLLVNARTAAAEVVREFGAAELPKPLAAMMQASGLDHLQDVRDMELDELAQKVGEFGSDEA